MVIRLKHRKAPANAQHRMRDCESKFKGPIRTSSKHKKTQQLKVLKHHESVQYSGGSRKFKFVPQSTKKTGTEGLLESDINNLQHECCKHGPFHGPMLQLEADQLEKKSIKDEPDKESSEDQPDKEPIKDPAVAVPDKNQSDPDESDNDLTDKKPAKEKSDPDTTKRRTSKDRENLHLHFTDEKR